MDYFYTKKWQLNFQARSLTNSEMTITFLDEACVVTWRWKAYYVLKRQFKTKQCHDIAPILGSSVGYCVKRSHNRMSESVWPKILLTPLLLVELQSINTVSHIWTLDWWCEIKTSNPLVQITKNRSCVTVQKSKGRWDETLKFEVNTSERKFLFPNKGISIFCILLWILPKQAQSHPQCCWSSDVSANAQGSKCRCESACNQFETTNLRYHQRQQWKCENLHQTIAFLLKCMWCKRIELTNKLQILLSVSDFDIHAKFVFSWPAWAVCGFAFATKGSKSHDHQLLAQVA